MTSNDRISTAAPTRSVQLARRLKGRIESGEFPPGERLPTFSALQDKLGVPPTTISRAYDHLEEEGLVRRVPGSGVYVAENAQGARVVGCWTRSMDPSKGYWLECISGIRAAVDDHGMDLMLLSQSPQEASWDRLDGVIYTPTRIASPPPDLRQKVSVSAVGPTPGLPSVVADDFRGGRVAAEHLIDLGHSRIAAFFLHSNNWFGQQRLAGYFSAMHAARIMPREEWILSLEETGTAGSFTQTGRQLMQHLLAEDPPLRGCTAVLAHNDEFAIGMIQALRAEGISVPEEVSVVGFDGTDLAQDQHPPLTTVHVPLRRIGYCAVEMVLRQVEDSAHEPDERLVLSVEFVEGGTTAPPAGLS